MVKMIRLTLVISIDFSTLRRINRYGYILGKCPGDGETTHTGKDKTMLYKMVFYRISLKLYQIKKVDIIFP